MFVSLVNKPIGLLERHLILIDQLEDSHTRCRKHFHLGTRVAHTAYAPAKRFGSSLWNMLDERTGYEQSWARNFPTCDSLPNHKGITQRRTQIPRSRYAGKQ